MRLESLKLVRYGRFTDLLVDFGKVSSKRTEELDFHLIYGPNEAGKSTFRAAALDFMFGFPTRTPYNFLHANDVLQIDGVLGTGDESHQLTRIKRTKSSLLGSDGQPVSGNVLRGVLGDIGRDGYANMFSLDEDLLEDGGDSILKSEGDLGELLFSSASGLSALSTALGTVRDETDEFYKLGARKFALAGMKEELDGLKREIRERDVLASQYEKLIKAEKAAHADYLAACELRDKNNAELKHLQALLDCVRPWFDYQQAQLRLEKIGELPQLPQGWLVEAQTLAQTAAASKRSIEDNQRATQRTRDAIDAIELMPGILELGARIDRLAADDLEANYKAAREIDDCERACRVLAEEAQQLCLRLPAASDSDPADLALPIAVQGQIKALIEPYPQLLAQQELAGEELQRAERELSELRELSASQGAVTDLGAVLEVLELVREDGDDRDLQQLERMLAEQEARIEAGLHALAPWSGSIDELRRVSIASAAQLDELTRDKAVLTEGVAANSAETGRWVNERASIAASLAELTAREELITDELALEVRQTRDVAWREHRDKLDGDDLDPAVLKLSANKVDAALAEDDSITALRFSQASLVASARQLSGQLRNIDSQIERCDERAQELASIDEALDVRTNRLCADIGLPADTPLAAIESWLSRREQLLDEARKIESLQAERNLLGQRTSRALARLVGVMTDHDLNPDATDWRTCVKRADAALASWQAHQQEGAELSAKLSAAEQELARRSGAEQSARSELTSWESQWTATLAGHWVEGLSAAEMSEVLRMLTELGSSVDKTRELRGRIERMVSDRTRYVSEVAELAGLAGCEFDEGHPLVAADRLRELLGQARELQRRHTEKSAELVQLAEDLEAAEMAQTEADRRFTQMTELFPAAEFGELLAAMRRSEERQQVVAALNSLRSQLSERLLLADFTEVEALLVEQLGSADAQEQVQKAHAALTLEGTEAEDRVAAAYHQWREAAQQLEEVSDDSDVARLQERVRVLLLDIETQARRYIALAAGTAVVEGALKTYLATHRSTMLERASAAFAAVTQGAFTGLDAVPHGNTEVLLGMRADGTSLAATAMSRGTRFQLYLSLRIAGYHEFVRHREPLPFFADDILETFDDNRSAETFALMAEMAQSGQVIYLTHHRHLCDLAQEVTQGRMRIHELSR